MPDGKFRMMNDERGRDRMNALRNIWAVCRRELGAYFTSPVAYVFIIIFLVLAGFLTFTFGKFYESNSATLGPFFFWHPFLYLFLVPALGMRLWAEERRTGTLELLMTMPLSGWQAVAGKFLAGFAMLALALALTFPMVITVAYLGDPDWGVLAAGYAGSLLVGGTYLAMTCLASAMTRNQVVGFIAGLAFCLLNLLAGLPEVAERVQAWAGAGVADAVGGFSASLHFEMMQRGLLELRGAVYFLTVPLFFLFATAVVLHGRRAN